MSCCCNDPEPRVHVMQSHRPPAAAAVYVLDDSRPSIYSGVGLAQRSRNVALASAPILGSDGRQVPGVDAAIYTSRPAVSNHASVIAGLAAGVNTVSHPACFRPSPVQPWMTDSQRGLAAHVVVPSRAPVQASASARSIVMDTPTLSTRFAGQPSMDYRSSALASRAAVLPSGHQLPGTGAGRR